MIILYDLDTKVIYGTRNGYVDDPDFFAGPPNIDRSKIGHMVVDKEWEDSHPEIVASMTMHKVVDPDRKLFEEDIRKTHPKPAPNGGLPCHKLNKRLMERVAMLEKELVDLKEKSEKVVQ